MAHLRKLSATASRCSIFAQRLGPIKTNNGKCCSDIFAEWSSNEQLIQGYECSSLSKAEICVPRWRKSEWQWSHSVATRKRLLMRFQISLKVRGALCNRIFHSMANCFCRSLRACYIMTIGNLHHRALFYAPQNREDSRSTDFKSRCFFSSFLALCRREHKRTHEASRSMARIGEWKLVSDSDWWQELVCLNYPTSVGDVNRKLDSFVKCSISTHSAPSFRFFPTFGLTNCDSSVCSVSFSRTGLGSGLASFFSSRTQSFFCCSSPEGSRWDGRNGKFN